MSLLDLDCAVGSEKDVVKETEREREGERKKERETLTSK
jgi:hypothetical protein